MSVAARVKLRQMAPARATSSEIQAIDDLLAQGNLVHGRRLSGGEVWDRRRRRPNPDEVQRQTPRRVIRSQIEIVRIPGWSTLPWLIHGFSTRTGGSTKAYRPMQRSGELNLGFTAADTRENVIENRRRFLHAIGAGSDAQLTVLRQFHSCLVRRVGQADAGRADLWKGDGLMTDEPGLLLGIQTADCIPVLIIDLKRRAVAAFHAGWRGTLKRIVENGIGRMRLEFRSRPEDLVAAIGPGIGACCYAVGEEVRSEFVSQFAYADELFREVSDSDPVREKYPLLFLTQRAPGHSDIGPQLHLDLMEANRRQLLDAGLRTEAIAAVGDCTRCQNNRYFSYRAEQGFTGRLLAVAGIRS
jgi:YfiH family protein